VSLEGSRDVLVLSVDDELAMMREVMIITRRDENVKTFSIFD